MHSACALVGSIDFIKQIVTLSTIVGLITSGLSISNMAYSFFNTGTASRFAVVTLSLLSELTGIFWVWLLGSLVSSRSVLIRYWASVYSFHDSNYEYTLANGFIKEDYRAMISLRLLLLATLSWLFGWTGGLVASQMAYRLAAYAIKAPYAIPTLQLIDLLNLLALTFTAVFAGGLYFVIKTRQLDETGA